MRIQKIHFLIAGAVLATGVLLGGGVRRSAAMFIQRVKGRKTVADRIDQFGPSARERLLPDFDRIGTAYPPDKVTLVGIKADRRLEVWVSDPPRFLKSYPILGSSGGPGPKLREGDRQVPEGLYRIESLNPNSMYHLSLRIDYPNRFDIAKGNLENRLNLGGDIMIHGKSSSVGCLAMGDPAIEELFILAAESGIENLSVILSPVDFRAEAYPDNLDGLPAWTPELYDAIRQEMLKLRQ